MAANAASPASATTPSAVVDVKPVLSRQPSLCMKPVQTPPAASPTAGSPPAQMSLTSKEWIIPPRPKPGRKPATDTPPTKRKAQNRAAQRAFRERRAARVGELEEQLKQIEDENDHEQEVLRRTVEKLEKELDQYRTDLAVWVDRCRKLEGELVAVKSSTSASKLLDAKAVHEKSSSSNDNGTNDTSIGCGNCTLETRCQCIDEAFTAMGGEAAADMHQHEKRPHSPVREAGEKRIKLEPNDHLEIDFTAVYSSKSVAGISRAEEQPPTATVADPCGFCSDGTPCICAEMAAEQEHARKNSNAVVNISRPTTAVSVNHPRQLDQFTPPPSEGDVSMSIPAIAPGSGCGAAGPGTCAQCRADPNSTLFCKSLAASRAQASGCGASGGCCRGGCQTQSNAVPLPPRTTRSRAAGGVQTRPMPQKAGVTLTCADAYTTLSRHPAYERASGDIANWLPKLHASDANPATAGRPALEIDAANVMAVLKDFDRRFGQNC